MSTQALIGSLTAVLFVPEERRLNGMVTSLNQRNKRLSEVAIDGFLYAGKLYMPTNVNLTVAGRTQAKVVLHGSLHEEMRLYLREREAVLDERKLISQMLFLLLDPCKTTQDIRDVLPECLVACVQGLSHYSRMGEPAFTLTNNPRAMRQYEKLLPTMEIYSAAGLLY